MAATTTPRIAVSGGLAGPSAVIKIAGAGADEHIAAPLDDQWSTVSNVIQPGVAR